MSGSFREAYAHFLHLIVQCYFVGGSPLCVGIRMMFAIGLNKFGSPSDLVSRVWRSTLSNPLLKSTSTMLPVKSSADLCASLTSACTVDVYFSDLYC